MNTPYRRLPLTSLHNARELGGWHTPEGMTQYGVFLRTDMHGALSEEDMAYLKDYGVTMDVDLRGASELKHNPDALRDAPWCEYVHMPTIEEAAERAIDPKSFRPKPGMSMAEEYVTMVDERKDWVRNVFEAFGRCEGAAMYHCTLGKDRTGVITALLLGLCGVSDEDIIADYSVTEIYMQWVFDMISTRMPKEDLEIMEPLFGTPPSNMETLLGHIRASYGTIPEYLRLCGVPEEPLAKIKARLLGKK